MARNNNRGSRNNNPSGRNQYSDDWGVMDMARERPIAAVAAAAGAAAAGLFLWSKRSQISNQLSNLSDQIGEWTENMGSSSFSASGEFDDTAGLTMGDSMRGGSTTSSSRKTGGRGNGRRGMSETGGGNASLGAHSGGAGTTSSASGRGRARQNTPV